jgi:3-oxoacyl-[acyl-carrier protein] reductase
MKNILIIGGTSGIGNALVTSLNKSSHLFITGRENKNLSGMEHQFYKWNTDEVFDPSFLPDELHGLVYCPGTINLKPINRLTEDDLLQDYQINVVGAFKVIKAVLPKLRKAKGSSVVLFSTVAANTGMPFHASIAAAKGGLQSFGLSLAAELANARIRVNVIAPSLTDTPLANTLLSPESKQEASKARHPLNRVGSAHELASMAKYLLSDDAAFITGQIFGVDGGIGTLKV